MKNLFLLLFLPFFMSCANLDGFLFNSKKQDKYLLPGNTLPASRVTQVSFKSGGETLYGFWVASDSAKALTILYCHGNKHSIDEYWDRVLMLDRLNVNIFIFDYRGFGLSTGELSEQGLHQDAEAALTYIKTNYGVADDSLILYGYSLGNVASIYLASRPTVSPRALIAECPFASANSLTQGGLGLDIPPLWLTDGKYDNVENIKKIDCKFLLFHGEKDDFVRYRDNGRVVFENAPNNPKKKIILENANHTDIPQQRGVATYLNDVLTWIQ